MNETIKTLLGRRSVRKFKPEQIKEQELQAILEAGMYAPSGANQQSALFVAVQDKETLKKLSAMNAAVLGKDIDPYYNAPTVVLVFADKSKVTPVEDGTLALGNMFNAAASLGIGSCWVHREKQMFETEEGKDLMRKWGITGDFVGVGSCILGYPAGELPKAAPRKDKFIIRV
ncbi:MAG: nitroreductase family protein [Deltaproteobacteria bacterium]|jgi:nitroreductase|nr:nitroreductase family protein [Deltaproteobacteria bacterium]